MRLRLGRLLLLPLLLPLLPGRCPAVHGFGRPRLVPLVGRRCRLLRRGLPIGCHPSRLNGSGRRRRIGSAPSWASRRRRWSPAALHPRLRRGGHVVPFVRVDLSAAALDPLRAPSSGRRLSRGLRRRRRVIRLVQRSRTRTFGRVLPGSRTCRSRPRSWTGRWRRQRRPWRLVISWGIRHVVSRPRLLYDVGRQCCRAATAAARRLLRQNRRPDRQPGLGIPVGVRRLLLGAPLPARTTRAGRLMNGVPRRLPLWALLLLIRLV